MPNARLWPTANLKPQIESRMTGRTDIIQGVQAEEREVTLSWVLTTPGDFSERDRTITFDWRIWSAARAETPRVPAIREFTDAWSRDPDIASILNTTLGQLPGMDSSVIDVFRQPPIILRVHAEFYAPSIVLTARKMAERTGKNPPDLDPDAPLLQLDQVVTELSDAPVDPSFFEIPKDYQTVSAERMRQWFQSSAPKLLPMEPTIVAPPGSAGMTGGVIGGIIGSVPTAAPPPPPPPAGANVPHTPDRVRVGGYIQQAKLIRQPKPVYPPLAKQARLTGTVKLNAIIGKDGTVQNLTVVEGHPLLIPAALEAVKQWVYTPTQVNGEFVEVVTEIDVNFTLGGTDSTSVQSGSSIVSKSTGKCLDVRGGSTADEAMVQQFACHGGPDQQWEIRVTGQIVSANSRKCLDLGDPGAAGGAAVEQVTCNGGETQRWEVRNTGEIVDRRDGMCLDAGGGSADTTALMLAACDGSLHQQWNVPQASPPADGIFRVGGGVTAPTVLQTVDPFYTEEARHAKLQGTVVLHAEVDTNGRARNIQVVRSLGLGLDEEAVKAAEQWKFRPGYKDGQPVVVAVTIQVNFRLK